MSNTDDLDELLEQLKDDTTLAQPVTSAKQEINVNDENVNEYIMSKVTRLIEGGVDTVEAIKESVLAGGEASEIEAYSELFRAVTGAIDTLNKVNLQNKKDKNSRELKELDIKHKLPGNIGGNTTNNIVVATREEIIKGFLNDNKEIILEADYDDIADEAKEDKNEK